MRTVTIGLAIVAMLVWAVNAGAQTVSTATASNEQPMASILGGSSSLPPQVGPPPNASADFLIAEGNALLAAGYVDAAIQDFQQVVNIEADTSPLVSKGWYGLARAYLAQNNLDLAKTSLEEVLSRNNDPESVNGARASYGQLKSRADQAALQAQQAYMYFQSRYYSISWLNFITKFFAWRDLSNAEKALTAAQTLANSFNPRYLIPPVGSGAAPMASETGGTALTPAELQTVLSQGSTSSGTAAASITANAPATAASAPSETGTATAAATPASVPAQVSHASETGTATAAPAAAAAPVDDLTSRRDAYLKAYKDLQTAMASRDPAAIQATTKKFQEAMAAYNDARNRAAAGQ